MSDAGFRRMLERATAEPPADLEARVFRAARHPWRWTAVAAAVVLVAAGLAWSVARRDSTKVGLTTDQGVPSIGMHPVGDGSTVATWLPAGFRETVRDPSHTTWRGPKGATITWVSQPSWGPCAVPCAREPFAPGYAAERQQLSDGARLVWCNGGSCGLEVHGVSELDAVRVAVGLVSRDRLSPDGTQLPEGLVVQETRPATDRNNYVYRFVFDETATGEEEQLLSQLPFLYPAPPPASIVTLTVGAAASYEGFEPVRSEGQLVGWIDSRLASASGPKPVVSFLKEDRLQGYVLPGRGFVWADRLFARRDPIVTTTTEASSVPTIAALPSEVVLVNGSSEDGRGVQIDLFGLGGAKLASFPGWRTHEQSGPDHEVLVAPDGRLYAITRSGLRASSAPQPPTHDRCGPPGRTGERVCGSEPGVHDVEPTITVERDGQAPRRITGSPIGRLGTQWRGYWGGGAELGPDGRTILATFIAECESPTMYFVDLVTGRAYQPQTGGEIRESVGMGWSAAGEAIVNFTTGVCGSAADEPGVYRLRPDGSVAGVVTRFTGPDPSYAVLVHVPD